MFKFDNWTPEELRRLKKQIGYAIFTFVVYLIFVDWRVAVLIMAGVSFHEYGHIWAAHRMGLKTAGFYLFPFVGGAATIDDQYRNYWQQSFTVLMGPIWGGALAFASATVYWLTGSVVWAGAASWLAWMNMFNLFPLAFLDGGQIMDTITYSLSNRLGLICKTVSIAVAVPVVWGFNPIISVLIAVTGFVSLKSEYRNYQLVQEGNRIYADDSYKNRPRSLSKKQIAITLGVYLVTLVSLFWLSTKMTAVNSASLTHLFGSK